MQLKLTAFTVTFRRKKVTKFAMLAPDDNGVFRIPPTLLDKTLKELGCTVRGSTFSTG